MVYGRGFDSRRLHQYQGLGSYPGPFVLGNYFEQKIRCLLFHAKDDAARQWYEAWEFEPSPTDSYHLFLMLKDLRGLISCAN